MASVRSVLISLDGADRGIRFDIVADLGKIRKRGDSGTYFLDFRPVGRVYRHHGIPITDARTARRLLEHIRGKVAEGRPLESVLAEYMPEKSKPNLVPVWVERWLARKRHECDGESISPTYLKELERYASAQGYFGFFRGISIHEVTFGVLEDWETWLSRRGLSPKTRRNILGAFRTFLAWLKKRGEIREVPEFPWPRAAEYEPRILSIEDLDRVLDAIPSVERGIFLALAHLGLRPGEARALDVADYDFGTGWLRIDKAMKGTNLNAPIRGTKTGKGKRLPVGATVAQWIEGNVDTASRLMRVPLFTNPRAGTRWSHWALTDAWKRATEAVGVAGVKLYEGTKHTMATDAVRRGVGERQLQAFLGHKDARSTRRYARLGDEALISVLRPPAPKDASAEDDLSRACPAGGTAFKKPFEIGALVVVPTGIEPVSPG